MPVDLGRLAEQADAERDRLHALLADGCARLEPGRPALEVARGLVRDHPDGAGVIDAARLWTERAIAFTRDHDLVPYHDGVCLVGPAPESRRWAMAMMSWAAPGEPEGPSWFHITPPDESWPEREQEEWLEVFSATTLPGIAVHEVAPGHFSHGRALRRLTSEVRRNLHVERVHRGLGALRRGTVRRGRVRRRRSQDRDRGLAGGAGPGDQAGVRHRRAHRRDVGRGRGAPVRGGYPPVRVRRRCPRPGAPPSTRPTAGTPGASSSCSSSASGPGRTGAPASRCSVSTGRCWTSAPPR